MLNTASRTFSEVGRVAGPAGARRTLPARLPPTIRTSPPYLIAPGSFDPKGYALPAGKPAGTFLFWARAHAMEIHAASIARSPRESLTIHAHVSGGEPRSVAARWRACPGCRRPLRAARGRAC